MRSIRRSQLIVDNYEIHVGRVAVLRLLVLDEGEIKNNKDARKTVVDKNLL